MRIISHESLSIWSLPMYMIQEWVLMKCSAKSVIRMLLVWSRISMNSHFAEALNTSVSLSPFPITKQSAKAWTWSGVSLRWSQYEELVMWSTQLGMSKMQGLDPFLPKFFSVWIKTPSHNPGIFGPWSSLQSDSSRPVKNGLFLNKDYAENKSRVSLFRHLLRRGWVLSCVSTECPR